MSAVKSSRSSAPVPNDRLERSKSNGGSQVLAGLDEVGRGAWAGPVSVGVVIAPYRRKAPHGLRDSKLLSEERREALYPLITEWCVEWSVGHADPIECDTLGMTAALRVAAHRALAGLTNPPDVVLMDGAHDYVTEPVDPTVGDAMSVATPEIHTVVKGDTTCVSIAAASIVAKVTRDRMMRVMSESFPGFDFHQNKGYPSPVHRTALAGHGLTSVHRRSWAYVEKMAFR